MTRAALSLLLCALAGCSTPATSSPDAGTDASASTDTSGGTDTASVIDRTDTGIDAAAIDTGVDAGAALDTGLDAASSLDTGADAASTGSDAGVTLDHLVFSEVVVAPGTGEYFEIWNPTAAAIALDDYYVSDNAVYHRIAAGMAWAPMETPGTDFLVRFPAGASVAAGAVYVVALNRTFETSYARCPDAITDASALTCTGGSSAAAMRVPTNGALDVTKLGSLLSDAREMLVLFRWDGAASTVRDADYVTWGATFDAGATRVDKSGVSGYQPDTAAASQHAAAPPTTGQSLTRCANGEVGETATGGNGIGGHDETSERLDTSFAVVATPTPGLHGSCP